MQAPSLLPLILNPCRDWDTDSFLTILWNHANRKPDPMAYLNTLPVKSMVYRKTNKEAEHEFLIFGVQGIDRTHRFILERNVVLSADASIPTVDDSTIDEFFKHVDSNKLLDAVHNAIESVQLPIISAAACTSAAAVPILVAGSLLAPLSISSPDLPMVDEGSSSSSYLPLTSTSAISPKYSNLEHASIKMAEILQVLSETKIGSYLSRSVNKPKPPKDSRADDRFLGEEQLKSIAFDLAYGKDVGEYNPKNLNLFHLALLANIVHQEYPLYSLFSSQCYWFASIVFYAVQIIDRDISPSTHQANSNVMIAETLREEKMVDDVFFPFNLFQPKEAGRWRGIMITGCKGVVLATIVTKFHHQLRAYTTMVSAYL